MVTVEMDKLFIAPLLYTTARLKTINTRQCMHIMFQYNLRHSVKLLIRIFPTRVKIVVRKGLIYWYTQIQISQTIKQHFETKTVLLKQQRKQ